MKKKSLILGLILVMLLGMTMLTGCRKEEQNQNNRTNTSASTNTTLNTTNENEESQDYNDNAPSKFEDCSRIVIGMGKESVVIFPSKEKSSGGNFNYILYKDEKQTNAYFSKWRVDLSKVQGLKDYLMDSKILANLKIEKNREYEDLKYKIEYNMTGKTAVYESNKNDEVLKQIYKLLKIGDESIYGEYAYTARKEGKCENSINNLKYDAIVKNNQKNAIYYAEEIYNYELINTTKKEKYLIEITASDPQKIRIEIDIQKAEEKDLENASAKKENTEKSLIELVNENWKDFYQVELSDQLDRYNN